jgi:hypothetical protein
MTKKLTLIFLFASQILLAQNKPQPTQFDKFVNGPGIKWAAYASDTVNFTSADLNNLLLKRISKKEIKASKPVESRTAEADKITYSTLDTIDQAFYGDRIDILMDSTGTQYFIKHEIPEKDSSNFKRTEVTQILYIEKGKLKSYIPFITPTLPVYMSSGNYIGERFYFTSCFNYTHNSKPSNKSKLIFLTQTKKVVKLDAAEPTNRLKEMYGNNLLETLWPYVLKDEIDAFYPDSTRKLKTEELNVSLVYNEPLLMPMYDDTGNIVGYTAIADPIDTKKFTDVQLLQDWYYDHKKNKVYSYIKEMILFAKKDDKETAPVLRLVFR